LPARFCSRASRRCLIGVAVEGPRVDRWEECSTVAAQAAHASSRARKAPMHLFQDRNIAAFVLAAVVVAAALHQCQRIQSRSAGDRSSMDPRHARGARSRAVTRPSATDNARPTRRRLVMRATRSKFTKCGWREA
jgi:hypothetical protein